MAEKMNYNFIKPRNRVFLLTHATLMPLSFLHCSSQVIRDLGQIEESLKSSMDGDYTQRKVVPSLRFLAFIQPIRARYTNWKSMEKSAPGIKCWIQYIRRRVEGLGMENVYEEPDLSKVPKKLIDQLCGKGIDSDLQFFLSNYSIECAGAFLILRELIHQLYPKSNPEIIFKFAFPFSTYSWEAGLMMISGVVREISQAQGEKKYNLIRKHLSRCPGLALEQPTGSVTPMCRAICDGDEKMMKVLNEIGIPTPNPLVKNFGPDEISYAMRKNRIDLIKEWIRYFPENINVKMECDRNALSLAALYRQVDTVKLLLEGGADPNHQLETFGVNSQFGLTTPFTLIVFWARNNVKPRRLSRRIRFDDISKKIIKLMIEHNANVPGLNRDDRIKSSVIREVRHIEKKLKRQSLASVGNNPIRKESVNCVRTL